VQAHALLPNGDLSSVNTVLDVISAVVFSPFIASNANLTLV